MRHGKTLYPSTEYPRQNDETLSPCSIDPVNALRLIPAEKAVQVRPGHHDCDTEIRADGWAMCGHRQTGDLWTCSCGKTYVHECDEAEGCSWVAPRRFMPKQYQKHYMSSRDTSLRKRNNSYYGLRYLRPSLPV